MAADCIPNSENSINTDDRQHLLSRDFILGDPDCSITDVVTALQPDKSDGLFEKFVSVAQSLGLTRGDVKDLKNRRLLHGDTPYDTYTKILERWKSQASSGATLNLLIQVLESHDLVADADNLRAAFNLPIPNRRYIFIKRSGAKALIFVSVTCLVLAVCLAAVVFLKRDPKTPNKCTLYKIKSGNYTALLDKWVENIQTGDYRSVSVALEACNEEPVTTGVLKELISRTYNGTLTNFENIRIFITDGTTQWNKYYSFAELYSAMTKSGHETTYEMMKLIYYLRISAQDLTLSVDLVTMYEEFKNRFPISLRSVMYGEPVKVRNRVYKEYIYQSHYTVENRNLILSWVRGDIDATGKFYFEHKLNRSGELYSILKNDYYYQGAQMCISTSYFNSERRKTVTCPYEDENDGLRWLGRPKGIVGGTMFFTLQNVDETFIYAPNNKNMFDRGGKRRYVFTWMGTPRDMSTAANWHYFIESYM